MELPYPQFELLENFSEGEVIDPSTPPSPVSWTKREIGVDKGKEKTSSRYAFMKDGLLSPLTLRILDEGRLISIPEVFNSAVVNLDKEVFKGFYARDILDSAMKGQLGEVMNVVQAQNSDLGVNKEWTNTEQFVAGKDNQ